MEKEIVWFTSDLHFSHENILKYSTNRREDFSLDLDDENVIIKHNDILINRWNMTIKKHDIVYILGDFSFASKEDTRKLLEKLNGRKHLIIGNHDSSCRGLNNYFESVSQIKEVTFKKHMYPFLSENIHCIMCHYPMNAWNRRMNGSLMLHGHCHGSLCEYNKQSEELRVDVGFDSMLGNCGFVNLEQLYDYMKNDIAKGKTFKEHIKYLTDKTGFRA